MPINNQEISFKKGSPLVTRTDLDGVITYANDAFVGISGFSRKELVGANQNIVRHPDMPSDVYADMWATLKKGRPWVGLIKNRAKDGSFYWAETSVAPVYTDGHVREYVAVRIPAKREDIGDSERFFQQIHQQKATLHPTGFATLKKSINEISIQKKATLALCLLLLPNCFFMYQSFLSQNYVFLAISAILTIVGIAVGMSLIRFFSHTIEHSIGLFYRLLNGNFTLRGLELKRNDQMGDFTRGLYSMSVKLNADFIAAQQVASENLRIRYALDNVDAAVMLADTNFDIIYLNKTASKLFQNAEKDFRETLPSFNSNLLLGSNIDIFHSKPSRQRALLETMTHSFITETVVSNHHIRIIASPVLNEIGDRIGFVSEWQDRTEEVKIEREIENLVANITVGDLKHRIDMNGKEGFIKTLCLEINGLNDVIESVFNDISNVMRNMAEGDLTSTITTDYQGIYADCKNNINNTLMKVSEIFILIRDAADFIESSSEELASGNNNLSNRAEQQAANLEETAASMEELTSTVQHNTESAHQAAQVANTARMLAEKGGEVVHAAISAMREINDSSNQIAEIIGVIDEIAFQTNLLALNASVEAARAGEHGRGFSVVATEVRNLAQRSAGAAQQSNDLIKNSMQKVRAGNEFVNQTGDALAAIVSSVKQVGDIVSHIAAASQEQASGISQVNQAVAQMDEITQQNAALAEQSSAASMSVNDETTKMVKLLDFFTISTANSEENRKPHLVASRLKHKNISKPIVKDKSAINKRSRNDEWEEF